MCGCAQSGDLAGSRDANQQDFMKPPHSGPPKCSSYYNSAARRFGGPWTPKVQQLLQKRG